MHHFVTHERHILFFNSAVHNKAKYIHCVLYTVFFPLQYSASDSCTWLTGMQPDVFFCCCNPSALKFSILCFLKCFSAHYGCTKCFINYIFETSYMLEQVCSYQHGICVHWFFSLHHSVWTLQIVVSKNPIRAVVSKLLKSVCLGATTMRQSRALFFPPRFWCGY